MQVIENMEECVLCSGFSRKFLNVVNQKYIYRLIEIEEIILRVVPYRVGVLNLESICRNVEHSFARVHLFCHNSDGIGKVSFSYTRFSINEKWTENSFPRIVGDAQGGSACQFVAFAFNQIVEIKINI